MIFEATQRTPLVEIESDRCLLRGECYPENIYSSELEIRASVRDILNKFIERYSF